MGDSAVPLKKLHRGLADCFTVKLGQEIKRAQFVYSGRQPNHTPENHMLTRLTPGSVLIHLPINHYLLTTNVSFFPFYNSLPYFYVYETLSTQMELAQEQIYAYTCTVCALDDLFGQQ